MLEVPVLDPDRGAPLQDVPRVEGPAEDPVGGGVEGDREVEGKVEDPGPLGGREVWAGGTGLPLHHGYWKAGAGRGGGCRECSVRVGGAGVAGRAGSGSGGGGCCGDSIVPAHARLHGVRRNGLGAGRYKNLQLINLELNQTNQQLEKDLAKVLFFVLSFVLHARSSFFCNLLGANHIFLGQAWAEGAGKLATCRHCADSDRKRTVHNLAMI